MKADHGLTSSCVASTAAGPDGDGDAPILLRLRRERRCKSAVPAAGNATKRTVCLTQWGPHMTRYKLECGHWVTGKTRATIPATMICDQCNE